LKQAADLRAAGAVGATIEAGDDGGDPLGRVWLATQSARRTE